MTQDIKSDFYPGKVLGVDIRKLDFGNHIAVVFEAISSFVAKYSLEFDIPKEELDAKEIINELHESRELILGKLNIDLATKITFQSNSPQVVHLLRFFQSAWQDRSFGDSLLEALQHYSKPFNASIIELFGRSKMTAPIRHTFLPENFYKKNEGNSRQFEIAKRNVFDALEFKS